MQIAFLGKGGSGKSTMATALVHELRKRGMSVLAIDADHNMDLSYNLGAEPSLFLGSDPELIKEHVGSERTNTYLNVLRIAKEKGVVFSITPADEYTAAVSIELEDGLRLITAGPHTDRVRSQEYCSHSLAAPLKVYLQLLRLNPNEAVVIDERAGTDPVATGILSGVDLAVIVREPTINSVRVAEQIKHELGLAGIRHLIVDNKQAGIDADTANAAEAIFAAHPLNVVSV
ncbi:MAG: dehydrogenase maturation factor [Candidatus Parcubacteria bacterium]|jgi:CO dehydrogenase maturation factor|nr:dehydrogenase maturation factor [Candidatus Parcubacteria bacterium]